MGLKTTLQIKVYCQRSDIKSTEGICLVVPDAIRLSFGCKGFKAIDCTILRHLDKDQHCIDEINQDLRLNIYEVETPRQDWVLWLRGTSVATSYGLFPGHFLEILCNKMILSNRDGKKNTPVEIYPNRVVDG